MNQNDLRRLAAIGGMDLTQPSVSFKDFNMFKNKGFDLLQDYQNNNLMQPPVDEEADKKAKTKEGLQNLRDTLAIIGARRSGNYALAEQMKQQVNLRKQQEEQQKKQAKRQADIEAYLNTPEGSKYRQAYELKNMLGIDMPSPTQRKIIKGADGFNYYADTGERVLPNVVTSPETSKRTTIKGADGFNYFVDTGERVLPSVVKNEKATDRKYEKAADGFFRYIDDGSKVFGDVEIVDPNFIEPTENNPMGLSKKEIFDRSDKLSDDFRAGSKDFIISRDSMKRILDAANDPSPFGDLSIIFSAMKVLDPNSVVRESEFKTVADAAPLLERLGFSKNKIEAIQAGNKLTNQQRADVVGTVLDFYKSAVISQKSLEEYYANRAISSGLKPDDVIFDYGATVVPKIQDFEFIVSLQNMSIDQLQNIDRSKFTDKQKEIFLKELKKRN
jgi:hypothetical protein